MTFDDFVRVGLGCLGLAPSVFWAMDFVHFQLAVEGWQQHEETQEQMHWERTRWMAAVMLSPHGKQGRPIQPVDLITFPWDSVEKSPTLKHAKQQAFKDLLSMSKPKES